MVVEEASTDLLDKLFSDGELPNSRPTVDVDDHASKLSQRSACCRRQLLT